MKQPRLKAAPRQAGLFGKARDDHRECRAAALRTAEQICALRGARLTPLRRRVLEPIWRSHDPIGAYAILDAMREGGQSAAWRTHPGNH